MTTLRLIFGDQLNQNISALTDCAKERDLLFMSEIKEEASYVKHHKKKLVFIFAAMRNFAQQLQQQNYQLIYQQYDAQQQAQSFFAKIKQQVAEHNISKIILTEPSEYRLLAEVESWSERLAIPVEIRADNRFLATKAEFAAWAKGKKELRMEYFYRQMRRKYNILLHGDHPEGGKWNYDSQNRKTPKKDHQVPQPYQASENQYLAPVKKLVAENFADHFGDIEPFHFAVDRTGALAALEYFLANNLKDFGDYQDAMLEAEPWLHHSHLGLYLNIGLLTPLECIRRAEFAYHNGEAKLNAVEGFIRQIMGWREYIRGIYWLKMPEYEQLNFFAAKRKLPEFFWNAETKLNCLKTTITDTKKHAYAHHIQRLMIIGNFALLTELAPEEVNEWFMIVYFDAYQWVELPNVTGMALYADGGIVASKPYISSGSYINKMSDYCKNCSYKISKKTGEEACPFNYLYWNFLIKHQAKLKNNQRMGMIYRVLSKFSAEQIQEIQHSSTRFLKQL